jgi:hypothetical protein
MSHAYPALRLTRPGDRKNCRIAATGNGATGRRRTGDNAAAQDRDTRGLAARQRVGYKSPGGGIMRVLITGGAGFVGSNLAVLLAERRGSDVVALDNLHRRGSELALPRLRERRVSFVRSDIRNLENFDDLPDADWRI